MATSSGWCSLDWLPWGSWLARASQLSVISCCLAEIPSYLMCGLWSRPERSPAYVMLPFARLLAFSLLLCSTLPRTRCAWLRTTLLFSERCIHRSFLDNLRRGRPRLRPHPLPLLTVVAPPQWCLGRRRRCRRPPPPPLPSRAGRGGDAKVRRPFRRLRRQTIGCREEVLLTGFHLCCGKGIACQLLEGTGRLLEPNPGCYPSWGTDAASPLRIPLLPSLAPRYRFRHIGQDLLGHWPCARRSSWCCPRTPWKSYLIRIPASPVPGKGSGGLASCDRPLSPERVCSANSVPYGDHKPLCFCPSEAGIS